MLKRLAALSSLLLATASCGDDSNPNRPDANPDDEVDAAPADAMPDAEPAVTTHSATVSILDVRVETEVGAVGAALGSGGQVVATMLPVAGDVPGVVDAVGQIYDDRSPTTGAGCAAFVWDLTVPELPPVGEDHGDLTITGSAQTIPPCTFVGDDYLCLGATGMGSATLNAITPDPVVTATAADQNFASITIPGATFSAADVGRYVKITGATHIRNNGTFPVIGFSATPAPTLIYVNPPAQAQTPDLSAVSYTTISGAGPVPTSPEFLADDAMVTVALDAPVGDEFEDYTTIATAAGDNFSMDTASTALTAIPVNGSTFTVGCNTSVFTHTGSANGATFNDESPGADQVTVTVTGIGAPNTRVGAEVTIAGATTATHNGTFTITAVGADTITYTNAAATVDEAFDAGTTATVADCGSASVSALSMDFSNADLVSVIHSGSGAGPNIIDPGGGGNPCQIMNSGMFGVGLESPIPAQVTISGAANAGNNGTFTITASDANSITFTNAGCTTEGFGAGTSYEVFDDISGATSQYLLPDPATSHATMIGTIRCAALASPSITVPAGASAALMMVDPARIRTVFLRGGLAQVTNADGTNPTNAISGHAIVGFTDP